jgi:hypothetical protein
MEDPGTAAPTREARRQASPLRFEREVEIVERPRNKQAHVIFSLPCNF